MKIGANKKFERKIGKKCRAESVSCSSATYQCWNKGKIEKCILKLRDLWIERKNCFDLFSRFWSVAISHGRFFVQILQNSLIWSTHCIISRPWNENAILFGFLSFFLTLIFKLWKIRQNSKKLPTLKVGKWIRSTKRRSIIIFVKIGENYFRDRIFTVQALILSLWYLSSEINSLKANSIFKLGKNWMCLLW